MLSSLDQDLMEQLATTGLPSPLIAGHDLFQEGDEAAHFWILQEGEMRVMRGIRVIGVIRAPAVLGQTSIFAEMLSNCDTRLHTMRAWTNCSLWQFPGVAFGRILSYRPKVLLDICSKYRKHLKKMEQKFGDRTPHRIKRMIDELVIMEEQISSRKQEVGVRPDSKKGFCLHLDDEYEDEMLFLSEHQDHGHSEEGEVTTRSDEFPPI